MESPADPAEVEMATESMNYATERIERDEEIRQNLETKRERERELLEVVAESEASSGPNQGRGKYFGATTTPDEIKIARYQQQLAAKKREEEIARNQATKTDRERELLLLDGQEPINVATFADSKSVPTSFAAIVEYESEIVLVFQGTINDFGREGVFSWDSLVDWIHNFRFQQVTADTSGLPGRVHEGFLEQLNLIYDQLASALGILKHKPVYITGHSQGGAIASLATKRLAQDKFDVTDTYTFGAPRAANSAFSRSVQSPYHRVEFGHDIVPHVPPALSQSSILNSGLSACSP